MRDQPTLLPASGDDAVTYLRSAASRLAAAKQVREAAVAEVREAVMAARVMKIPWDVIGAELGVTRQAAAERFGGGARTQLVLAWHSIEVLLAEIAATRQFSGRPLSLLRELERDGFVRSDFVSAALRLYEARSAAVHGANTELTIADVEQLTDIAIPLAGALWMLRSADEPQRPATA
jgi:hypothetical protein